MYRSTWLLMIALLLSILLFWGCKKKPKETPAPIVTLEEPTPRNIIAVADSTTYDLEIPLLPLLTQKTSTTTKPISPQSNSSFPEPTHSSLSNTPPTNSSFLIPNSSFTEDSSFSDYSSFPTPTISLPQNIFFTIFSSGGINMLRGLDSKTNPALFYSIGASVDFRLGKSHLLLEPGVRYNTKSTKYSGYSWGAETTCEEAYSYLDVFLKARWNILLGNRLDLQPYVGYATGVLLTANSKLKLGGYTEEVNIKKDCNTSAHIGLLGLDFVINNHLSIGAEYNLGLSDVWISEYPKVKHDTVMLNLGYKF